MFNRLKGQVGLIPILSIAGTILATIIAGYFQLASGNNAEIQEVKDKQQVNNLAIIERVTRVETKVEVTEKKIDEIGSDVKALLKIYK